MKNKLNKFSSLAVLGLLLGSAVGVAEAQDSRQLVRGKNLVCAGYIQVAPVTPAAEVVGGEEEQEQNTYSNGDFIYVNSGTNKGVKVGDRFSFVRPRGKMTSRFTSKGVLGKYIQELGEGRVVNVKDEVAVVKIDNACEMILLGDYVVPMVEKFSPLKREEPAFNRFANANGKTTGRIVFARDNYEMVSREQIVYLDLGIEDGVKVGDYLTVYRPLGKGGVTGFKDNEIVAEKDSSFQSEVFRGGEYSNQSPRRKGQNAQGVSIVTGPNAKSRRPNNLRKIVGELVILNVKEKTATAIITRTAQEIHTGDFVEMQ